jgi:hypothetical protein
MYKIWRPKKSKVLKQISEKTRGKDAKIKTGYGKNKNFIICYWNCET